jgi:hypothetical protein
METMESAAVRPVRPAATGRRQRRDWAGAAQVRTEEAGDAPNGWLQLGFAVCMVFEVVLAMILGAWLGGGASGHFMGVWHALVFWIVCIAGTLVCWCAFLVGFACLFNFCRRDDALRTLYEKNGSHIS